MPKAPKKTRRVSSRGNDQSSPLNPAVKVTATKPLVNIEHVIHAPRSKQPLPEARYKDETYRKVVAIFADTFDIPAEQFLPGEDIVEDLGVDSLDFLDAAFAIDKAFGIKMPLERWAQEVNDEKSPVEFYFVLGQLCQRIDELVAAKAPAPV